MGDTVTLTVTHGGCYGRHVDTDVAEAIVETVHQWAGGDKSLAAGQAKTTIGCIGKFFFLGWEFFP